MMQRQKVNVIVLGSNGQLGSDIIKIFTANFMNQECVGNTIIGLTRKDINLDVNNINQDNLKQVIIPQLSSSSLNYIINCIATTNVDKCEDDSTMAFSVNVSFVYQLAQLCNDHNATLFHISTDYIFSGNDKKSYTEEAIPSPVNIYGLSKYSGEKAIAIYHDKYFIFRVAGLFGIAGASGKGGNFITTMQHLGKTRNTIQVIADQITCPTATLAVARAIYTFINNNITNYGIYNCVSSNECSWFEFAEEIFKLSNMNINCLHKAEFANYPFIARRPQYTILDTSKISKYYKMPTWQESLAEYFTLIPQQD